MVKEFAVFRDQASGSCEIHINPKEPTFLKDFHTEIQKGSDPKP